MRAVAPAVALAAAAVAVRRRRVAAADAGEAGTAAAATAAAAATNSSSSWDPKWDGRPAGKKGVVHTVLLVRHGQYKSAEHGSNLDELTLDSQRVLTSLGREQATATGKRIDDLIKAGVVPPVTRIYYSTMARATETSKLIQAQLSAPPPSHHICPCSMIQEGAVCVPEPPFAAWNPSAEEFEKEGKRVEAGFVNHMHRAPSGSSSTSLLVCHGNVIRYFVLRALQYNPAGWSRLAVFNASITRIDIHSDGHVTVKALGEVGHLPAAMVTYQ